jgi:aldehyde:ferredoxin oxidoreductase
LYGYAGQILYVNLSTGKTHVEKLDESTAKKYLGGLGLGMKLWFDNSKAGVDALDSENPLVLAIGPVAGTMFPTGGNGHVFVSKSPASGAVSGTVAHGSFGAELKRAGYDAVVLTGKSSKLVYLWIDDDSVQLLNANRLLGKSPSETEDAIKEEIGDYYIRVASIGLAGEKLSKIACIINDKTRAAGRIGLGAVMGSKNLKAIAVRGTHDIFPAAPDGFMEMVKEYHERMKGNATEKYTKLGTVEDVLVHNALNCLPTRNYSTAHFENAEKVSGEALNARFVAKIIACGTCPMPCEHEVIVPEGPYKGAMTRMEYESLWAMGPYCGVDRLDAVVKAVELCNYYGLDAQSVGVTIGFVMDCHEKGILSHQDLGVDAHFGNAEALLYLVEKMGKREGIGERIADGVKVAADKIGKESQKLAQHIKGLEVSGYDLRCFKTAALGFAVSYNGADNDNFAFDAKGKVDHYTKGRAKHVADLEDIDHLINSFMVCKFSKAAFHNEQAELAKLYFLVTGYEISPEELKKTAERINTLTRLVNIREGLSRKEDTLPWKVMHEPIPNEGPAKGAVITHKDLNALLDDYYRTRGWTQSGNPTSAKLKELELDELSPIIESGQAS